ncbi:MAG: iron-containing alcohol dehydrogenase [Candidatus Omnitrophica bacterium]|nr:iron-containing alcohol dehydrogenase [Candidatus Omnitrophota bacterium]MBU4333536.1 iron-containing alcohol dehydrogenase [Candidatus Omnitrophota bacterium]
MTEFKNIKNIPKYIFEKGSISSLSDIVKEFDGFVVYFIDKFFQDNDVKKKIPARRNDLIQFIDTADEPKTSLIDKLCDQVKANGENCTCVVGLGGGSVLDIAKAVSNMLTNKGKAEDYQGWDLVENPGVYKIGIPTLSGTGSEASRTCVLTNVEKGIKLGMNSDYSMFDQLILDPDLTKTVPRDQYFYTGMDTYLHCMESLNGSYRNVVIDALSQKAIELCREVFLSDDMMSEANREKMMIASYFGGCAAGNVGVVHPLSAGLSIALGYHHGIANCLVMNILEEYYPYEYVEFKDMMEKQKVSLPTGLCSKLDQKIYEKLYSSSIIHEKPLTNALGAEFKTILTKEKMISLFKRI